MIGQPQPDSFFQRHNPVSLRDPDSGRNYLREECERLRNLPEIVRSEKFIESFKELYEQNGQLKKVLEHHNSGDSQSLQDQIVNLQKDKAQDLESFQNKMREMMIELISAKKYLIGQRFANITDSQLSVLLKMPWQDLVSLNSKPDVPVSHSDMGPTQAKVIELVKSSPEGVLEKDVCDALALSQPRANKLLKQLEQVGEISRDDNGRYYANEHDE
ncbi:MAG: hypothetical protein ABIC95_06000 [archaeon]